MWKNNIGYDVKQLFIGLEGILGIIIVVLILVLIRLKIVNVVFFGCESFLDVFKIYKLVRSMLGEILLVFEFLDDFCMDFVEMYFGLYNLISKQFFYVLLEIFGLNSIYDEQKFDVFFEKVMVESIVQDGILVIDFLKMKIVWDLRERIVEVLMYCGIVYKYDLFFLLLKMYEFVLYMREKFGDKVINVVGYGYFGDGNLYLNFIINYYSDEVLNLIELYVYEWIVNYRGSISVEYGLGFKKVNYIYFLQSSLLVIFMKGFK